MRVSSDCDFFFFSKHSPHQKSATQVFQIETFILNLQNICVIEAHSGKTEDYFILFTGLLNTGGGLRGDKNSS